MDVASVFYCVTISTGFNEPLTRTTMQYAPLNPQSRMNCQLSGGAAQTWILSANSGWPDATASAVVCNQMYSNSQVHRREGCCERMAIECPGTYNWSIAHVKCIVSHNLCAKFSWGVIDEMFNDKKLSLYSSLE